MLVYQRAISWDFESWILWESMGCVLGSCYTNSVSFLAFGGPRFTTDLKKLDDGWPESVEEQGLLLLVWRRNFRNDL